MKTLVVNRNNIELSVVVEGAENSGGLVFLVHGLGGIKEQIHIRAVAEMFLAQKYTVVTYDAANTIGESGGKMEDATLTSYFEDFEDVVEWAESQEWFKSRFIVSGHSLGGACSILYAAKYPKRVNAIIPISAFIAGKLYRSVQPIEFLKNWQKQGYILEESKSKPGVIKRINWSFVDNADQYDLREIATDIHCPALFITGSEDNLTPGKHQQMMIDKMNTQVDLKVIFDMKHNPRSKEHIDEIVQTIEKWLSQVFK